MRQNRDHCFNATPDERGIAVFHQRHVEKLCAPIEHNATAYMLAQERNPLYNGLRQTFELQDARARGLRLLLRHRGIYARQRKACVWKNARIQAPGVEVEVLPSNGVYQVHVGDRPEKIILFDVRRAANLVAQIGGRNAKPGL